MTVYICVTLSLPKGLESLNPRTLGPCIFVVALEPFSQNVLRLTMITLYEPLGLAEGHKLLEIGLGSGYSAVVACETVTENGLVVCIEIDPVVFEEGKRYVEQSGYGNVILVQGDGGSGYPDMAPYDRICITAACTEVPSPLFEQLKVDGKLIAPVLMDGKQSIILFEKKDTGIEEKVIDDVLLNISYVPMRGEYGTKN
jgi:protein-L-isoaspartate(D-aspartate) O-methyltransferase